MKHLILILFCALTFACAETKTEKYRPQIGDDVIIQSGANSAAVAVDEESLMKFTKIAIAKDDDAYNAMLNTGKLFLIENGTKARMTDGAVAVQVKILDGKFKDKYVWLSESWLKPLK